MNKVVSIITNCESEVNWRHLEVLLLSVQSNTGLRKNFLIDPIAAIEQYNFSIWESQRQRVAIELSKDEQELIVALVGRAITGSHSDGESALEYFLQMLASMLQEVAQGRRVSCLKSIEERLLDFFSSSSNNEAGSDSEKNQSYTVYCRLSLPRNSFYAG
jgi:hypothetical protein